MGLINIGFGLSFYNFGRKINNISFILNESFLFFKYSLRVNVYMNWKCDEFSVD